MKKFTKLFLSCMAVSAITAAIATSAMAADITGGQVTGSYDEATGKITASVAGAAEGQSTILVLKPNTDVAAVKDSDIVYIDQQGKAEFAGGLLGSPAEGNGDGIYTVMVGYNAEDGFKIASGQFTIGNVGETIIIGEVDGAGKITTNDAACVLRYANGREDSNQIKNAGKTINVSDGTTLLVGEVDGAGKITTNDAACILRYANGREDENQIKNVGSEVVGTIVDTPAAE